jgi:hypothetical protein
MTNGTWWHVVPQSVPAQKNGDGLRQPRPPVLIRALPGTGTTGGFRGRLRAPLGGLLFEKRIKNAPNATPPYKSAARRHVKNRPVADFSRAGSYKGRI